MLVVSYFTENSAYKEEAKRLFLSLDTFNIESHIEAVKNQGSWVRNCAYKPSFIKRMLQTFNKPVIWLDADAEVLKPLDLFEDPDFDFAVYRRVNKRLDLHCGPWNSGTLYFDPKALELVERWEKVCKEEPQVWDQKSLYKAFCGMQEPPRTYLLPWSYCAVFDEKNRPEDPHILHHQASRRLKRTIPSL